MEKATYVLLGIAIIAGGIYLAKIDDDIQRVQSEAEGLRQDLAARDLKFKELQELQKANYEMTLEVFKGLPPSPIMPPLPSAQP